MSHKKKRKEKSEAFGDAFSPLEDLMTNIYTMNIDFFLMPK